MDGCLVEFGWMDGWTGRWVDAPMECCVDACAWWLGAWRVGDAVAIIQH